MKKRTGLLLALPFALLACNNEGKDSVQQADSANQAKMDSNNTNNNSKQLTTDAETASFMVKAADAGAPGFVAAAEAVPALAISAAVSAMVTCVASTMVVVR